MSRRDRSVFVGFSGLHGVIGIEKKILNNISPERFHLMQIGGLSYPWNLIWQGLGDHHFESCDRLCRRGSANVFVPYLGSLKSGIDIFTTVFAVRSFTYAFAGYTFRWCPVSKENGPLMRAVSLRAAGYCYSAAAGTTGRTTLDG
ncbi:hypothetical protein R16034_01340 [Ralstonia edaphis]|uniref:Uncharacterized protein n=1 Tax=Ralstonia edaphi TaxID=3058599 RepID=A0AB72X416_9RALS|nr:hypothetical protein R16034_01340 [Ralstonia sp. LMG 6871]